MKYRNFNSYNENSIIEKCWGKTIIIPFTTQQETFINFSK